MDLFFDSMRNHATDDPECKHLHTPTRKPVWFGSYFTPRQPKENRSGGYFLAFPPGNPDVKAAEEMVFTVTIDTHDAETLPLKGDKELEDRLREASSIVSSIEYK